MARPRRVALVIGQLTRGGAEGQLAQLVQHLDRRRWEPIVYCLSASTEPIGTEMAATGVVVHAIVGGAVYRIRQLLKRFAADRIDLVHAWLYLANAIAGATHLAQPRRRLITSARNCKLQGRVSQVANLVAFRISRAIVANSHEVAAYIMRHYWAPAPRIHVMYNGIDIERFHPGGRTTDGPGPIITVGRLVEQKNHEMFLQAAAALSRRLPDVRFVIVGDGPRRALLEAQARQLGIAAHVSFAGERHDIEDRLRDASLFWLTSRWEGMPNVVLEAMASGTPVIATDVGGTRELIRSGVEGFVVPAGDCDGIVQRSQDLLGDAATRRQFAQAARARAEQFATQRMVDAMADLYDEVMQ